MRAEMKAQTTAGLMVAKMAVKKAFLKVRLMGVRLVADWDVQKADGKAEK